MITDDELAPKNAILHLTSPSSGSKHHTKFPEVSSSSQDMPSVASAMSKVSFSGSK
jgi:hypothetical protein